MQGPLEEIYLMVGIDQFFGELAEFSYLSMGKLIQGTYALFEQNQFLFAGKLVELRLSEYAFLQKSRFSEGSQDGNLPFPDRRFGMEQKTGYDRAGSMRFPGQTKKIGW